MIDGNRTIEIVRGSRLRANPIAWRRQRRPAFNPTAVSLIICLVFVIITMSMLVKMILPFQGGVDTCFGQGPMKINHESCQHLCGKVHSSVS
ncbi:hypothetical protein TanjilG_10422 [Lupinus angustifolius]|uniref:Uncharacterized protein n=1 Tax=Lupinus angustifolius TaxID=3871 RepID=A0A4P1R4H8_LUPAN|nr:hypothetical protein TanjilG_10422 [Lupinus angustifolius]